MKNIFSGHKLDTIFVLVIFCVFSASVLVVLTLGGLIYKNISATMRDSFNQRTSLSYIWSKAKNGDASGGARIVDFNGAPALRIKDELDGVTYLTTIYLYNGWICELVGEDGVERTPADGVRVLEADSLSFERLDGGLIRVAVDGNSLYIYPRVSTGAVF